MLIIVFNIATLLTETGPLHTIQDQQRQGTSMSRTKRNADQGRSILGSRYDYYSGHNNSTKLA